MRLFFGIILGILLTVGVAYIADAMRKTGGGTTEPPIVNWDVVGRKLKVLSELIQDQWARWTGKRKDV